jgi:hypothetical protein
LLKQRNEFSVWLLEFVSRSSISYSVCCLHSDPALISCWPKVFLGFVSVLSIRGPVFPSPFFDLADLQPGIFPCERAAHLRCWFSRSRHSGWPDSPFRFGVWLVPLVRTGTPKPPVTAGLASLCARLDFIRTGQFSSEPVILLCAVHFPFDLC